jgi:hypothetical protein
LDTYFAVLYGGTPFLLGVRRRLRDDSVKSPIGRTFGDSVEAAATRD